MFGLDRYLVAMPEKDAGGVSTETPADSGVPGEGMPTQGTGDASGVDPIQTLQAKLQQAELDRRKLQASLQSGAAEREKKLKAQMDALQADLMSKMDEKERAAYEANLLREQNEQLKQQLDELRSVSEQQQVMQQWVAYFKDNFDVSEEELDLTDPQALIQSGWTAAAESHKKLKGGVKPPEKNVQRPASKQTVLTGSNGSPSTGPTIASIQAALSAKYGRPISLDEVFTRAEKGEVDLSQIKG